MDIKNENGDKLEEKIVFVVKDLFDKDLNLKEKDNKNKNEVKDYWRKISKKEFFIQSIRVFCKKLIDLSFIRHSQF